MQRAAKQKWVVAKKKRVPRRRKEEHDSKRWEEVLNGNEGHGDNEALMGVNCQTAGSELVLLGLGASWSRCD